MSRPEKPIDWKLVDKLLVAGCLGTEIAAHFDMHQDTFYRRVEDEYGIGFTLYSAQKKQKGESLLRNKQFDTAMSGDKTMLIWLGKQRLGQKEHHEIANPPNDANLNFADAFIRSEAARIALEKKVQQMEAVGISSK